MALVAERTDPQTGQKQIIAVARLQGLGQPEAEFSIVVTDDYQNMGLGTELLRRLIDIGRKEGVKAIIADILAENTAMQRVAERLGFRVQREIGEPVVSARLELA
jgi:acetyltransferase